jgi:hypothetical protein
MRRLIPVVIVVGVVFLWDQFQGSSAVQSPGAVPASVSSASDETIARAFQEQRNGLQVEGAGIVRRVLADDNDGSRHQRFILQLGSGQTLLIAHNIDVAPRVPGIREGDSVRFFGEYEWNDQGGVIHWTHHDPDGRHVAGWLEHGGRRYQ